MTDSHDKEIHLKNLTLQELQKLSEGTEILVDPTNVYRIKPEQRCEAVLVDEAEQKIPANTWKLVDYVGIDEGEPTPQKPLTITVKAFAKRGRNQPTQRKGIIIYSKEWMLEKHCPPFRLLFLNTTTKELRISTPVDFISKHAYEKRMESTCKGPKDQTKDQTKKQTKKQTKNQTKNQTKKRKSDPAFPLNEVSGTESTLHSKPSAQKPLLVETLPPLSKPTPLHSKSSAQKPFWFEPPLSPSKTESNIPIEPIFPANELQFEPDVPNFTDWNDPIWTTSESFHNTEPLKSDPYTNHKMNGIDPFLSEQDFYNHELYQNPSFFSFPGDPADITGFTQEYPGLFDRPLI